jgi:hypothetical protein
MSYDPADLPEGYDLCVEAAVDPDTQLTRFTLVDYAAALIGAEWDRDRIIAALQNVDPSKLGDLICIVSHWDEAFVDYALAEGA